MNHHYRCIVCNNEAGEDGKCSTCIENDSTLQECSICKTKFIHDKGDLLSCHKCFYYFKPPLEKSHVPYGKYAYKKYIIRVKFYKYHTYTAGHFADECEKYTEKTNEIFYFPLIKNVTKDDMNECGKINNINKLINIRPNISFKFKSTKMTYKYVLKDAYVVQRVGNIKLR